MTPSDLTVFTDPVTGADSIDVLQYLAIHRPHLLKQPCLDHGFVNIVDVMPRLVPLDCGSCDFSLADAARLSYQKGTRKVSTDAGLIDNLIRNRHTSPIEMGELKFHIRLPIFVMRQHVRHRTASLNEESARYSQLAGDFYIPEPERWAINTSSDKQATQQGKFTPDQARQLHALVSDHNERSYALYEAMLYDKDTADCKFDDVGAYTGEEGFNLFLDEIANKVPGLGREQARMILGVNIYTQCYWKVDLKNLLHYISLRSDPHAQYEIRVFSDAIRAVTAALFPQAWSSFQDHFVDGVNFGREEMKIAKALITDSVTLQQGQVIGFVAGIVDQMGWTGRRLEEFSKKLLKSGFVSKDTIAALLEGYKALLASRKTKA